MELYIKSSLFVLPQHGRVLDHWTPRELWTLSDNLGIEQAEGQSYTKGKCQRDNGISIGCE